MGQAVSLYNSNLNATFTVGAHGLQLSTIADLRSANTYTFDPNQPMWEVLLVDASPGGPVPILPDVASGTYAVSATAAGQRLTAMWVGISIDPSTTLTCTVTVDLDAGSDSLAFGIHVVVNPVSPPRLWTIYEVRFPIISAYPVQPTAAQRLSLGIQGGYNLRHPIEDLDAWMTVLGTDWLDNYVYPGEYSVQFNAFYDMDSNQVLYLATDDGRMRHKRFSFNGSNGGLGYRACHIPEDNRHPGLGDYTVPYNVLISTFESVDGKGWYDAAARYREWAEQQVWCNQGPWAQDPQSSLEVKKKNY